MIQDVLAFAKAKVEAGNKVALLTVTETQGSSPASAGQFMAVLENGTSAGTVGGGKTEYLAIQQAIQAIGQGKQIFPFHFDHGENGMICGGSMTGFGNVLGNENHLTIFGGGHIGQSLASLAVSAGFYVTVVEDRPELEQYFTNVNYLVCQPQEYEKKLAFTGLNYVVICTRGHKTDDDALRYCLKKNLQYLGMIGSLKKVGQLFDQLKAEGITQQQLDAVYAPVGLNIASEMPAEIAIAILAEILMVKNQGKLVHRRLFDYQKAQHPE